MKTKNYLVSVCALVLMLLVLQRPAIAQNSAKNNELLKYQDEITESYLKKHLTAFSHDSLEGRETGMPGQKKAARYLSEQFKKLGLKPVGDNNSYYQKFDLNTTVNDSVIFETYQVTSSGKNVISRSVASQSTAGQYIRAFGGTDIIDAEIVFAGFGVNDSEKGVNHLEGADLAGKWVMVFQEIPYVVDGDTLIGSTHTMRSRLQSVIQKKAKGIILIPAFPNEDGYRRAAMQAQASYGNRTGMSLAYRDTGESNGFSQGYNIINPTLAAKVLGLNDIDALQKYRDEIIESITEFQAKNTGFGLKHTPYSHKEVVVTENVLGLIEGGDPELKDEVVVLSAHYDHVGIGRPDSTGDRIYNGANDDGSGTIGTLNAAKALAKARDNGLRPKRSVLFLMVSGEEKGLLGSRYYSDHPVIPIEKTVANINTDMIGRVDPEHRQAGNNNYVYIIGSEIISSQMDSLLVAANKESGNLELDKKYNDLSDPQQFYRRSDHWNFGRFGVPFVFFFNGVHEDYHRPSDEIDKMQFDLLAKTTRTMYATTVMVANTKMAPEVDNQEFIEITKGN